MAQDLVLTLEVGPGGAAERSRRLSGEGLTIGRASTNDWVLPDPERVLSGRHCTIARRGEDWWLTDTSTNGVYVDDATAPVGKGGSIPLRPGMRLTMGDYVLRVTAAGGASSAGEAPEPRPVSPPPAPSGRAGNALFDESWLGGKPLDAPVHPVPREQGTPFTRSDHLPPDAVALDLPRSKAPFADAEPVEEAPAASPDARKRAGSIFDESWFGKREGASAKPSVESPPPPPLSPPPVVTSEPRRPSPFDEPAAESKRQPIVELPPPPPPVAPPPPPVIARPVVETAAASSGTASPEAARAMLLAFLEGAGLDPAQIRADDPEALMRELGRRFRAMSQGLVRLLELRARLKQESGLERTRVAASGNNPLKLTASGREAALWLVQSRGEGYLEPLPAIAATLQDLEAFMPELLSAMHGALRRLVGRFDPVLLEQELADAGLLELLAAGGRKARCWELFKERYGEIAAEAEARFLREVGVDLGRPHRPKERG